MSDQPQRPNPADSTSSLPPEPVSTDALAQADNDAVFGEVAPPTDDTPTVITKIQPRPNQTENLFSGILRGRKLAHFELLEPIGVGGMAAVIRARDTQLERFVALKILPPEMAADSENIARFHQEARAAARLDHETIARVFFCGEDQNLHFIAFEFVEGENLRTLIDRRGQLPVPEALHYMLQVATGLTHAAERGVVHRDIKPSNIIISPNGRAKLVDMGLARNLGPQTDDGLTQSGVTLGTFDYISPEQALEPRDADVRSDIYSLGCTFYHVLTGQPPVPDGTAARKLHHHQHIPPIDPRQLNPDIPDEVAAILGRMMAKDPRQRYQRPEQLVQHLLQATHQLGAGSEVREGMLFVDAALPSPPRTRPLLVAGCAAVLVVALVLLIGSSRDFQPNGSGPNPDPKQPSDPLVPRGLGPIVDNTGPKGNNSGNPTPPGPNPAKSAEVKEIGSWKDLVDLAPTTDTKTSYTIVFKEDLWPEDGAGIVSGSIILRGKTIILRGDNKSGRRVLGTRYVAAPGWEWGIDIQTETIELQHLTIVADNNNNTPGQDAAAVRLMASGQVKVSDCEFFQGNTAEKFSSVAVQQTPNAVFERCCFLGAAEVFRPDANADGWWGKEKARSSKTAVAVFGKTTVAATDCAFGPHAALFRFGDEGSTLRLRSCTALVGDDAWSLAQVSGDGLPLTVKTENCFFGRAARPADAMMGMPGPVTAVLVRGKATYEGQRNCYFSIDAAWPMGDDAGPAALAAGLRGTGEVLPPSVPPWKAGDPFRILDGAMAQNELRAAFKLDFKSVSALLLKDPLAVVGMRDSPWGLPEWTAKEIAATGDSGVVRIVDPTAEPSTEQRVYSSLKAAVADAKTNDVIEIRAGELPINRILDIDPNLTLTIRAEKGSRPILILDPKGATDKLTALFRLSSGQLNFEDLEFRIQPNRSYDGQAVVLLPGDGTVQFSRCVVTLDSRKVTEVPVPLAAITLPGPKQAMMMPMNPVAASSGPKVSFDSCFIRGQGDLVLALASQPFKLDMTNTLAALTGSLINVSDGSEMDAQDGSQVSVQLNKVTAYLGGHLARLHAASLKKLVQIDCKPNNSLLVSASGNALIHLDSTGEPDTARTRVALNGANTNYANFSPMMEQQQPENQSPPATVVNQKDWETMGKENQTKFVDVKFKNALPALMEASPADFDINSKETLKDKGADPQKLPAPR